MNFPVPTPASRSALIVLGVLASVLPGCATDPIGGPVAPKGAPEAGLLTLSSGRSYPVYPAELAYSGEAAYRWPDGRTYDGRFEAGTPEGMGAGTWPNGDRYRGTWHAGRRHGHGELNRADGSRYVGDFAAGRREGSGVEQSGDGLYRGQWRDDLPNGKGEFHAADGAAYQGQWVDGRRQGEGSYTDRDGNTYQGGWFADAPDGFGVMENVSGSLYEGEWASGQQNGYGRMTSEAGVIYEGTWVDGRRQGFGVARRPDGSRYEGEWADGRRHGQGRESFADGSWHEGAWAADRPSGTGTRRDRTGIELGGLWDGDELTSGFLRLPSAALYTGTLLTQHNKVVHEDLLAWLEPLAADGDPWAGFFLGTAYTDFASPAPDPFRATTHFRMAARAGIPDGQFRLALLLTEKHPDQALQWLRQAAAASQAQANTLLGEYYLSGRFVDADLATAVHYLRAGSDAGDMTARNNLAWVLATAEDPALRDGEAALALIRPLALMLGGWQHLDTLAAAQAAVGDYASASDTAGRAIDEATESLGEGNPEIAAMAARLAGYRAALQADDEKEAGQEADP